MLLCCNNVYGVRESCLLGFCHWIHFYLIRLLFNLVSYACRLCEDFSLI